MKDKLLACSVKSVAVIEFLENKRKRKPKKLENNMKKGEMAVTQEIKRLASCHTLTDFSVRDFLKGILM